MTKQIPRIGPLTFGATLGSAIGFVLALVGLGSLQAGTIAENDDSEYVAYVSEQNLVLDDTSGPVSHPQVSELFEGPIDGAYRLRETRRH